MARMKTLWPTRKVTAAALGAAVAAGLTNGIDGALTEVPLPALLSTIIPMAAALAMGWIVPPSARDQLDDGVPRGMPTPWQALLD